MKHMTPAQQEIRLLLNEADEISNRTEVSRRDESRLSYLFAKVKAIQAGHTEDRSAECRQWFGDLFKGREVRDITPMEAGAQTPTYTAGSVGGFIVPQEFHNEVVVGAAQFDPLLNDSVVTLIQSGNASLNPYVVPSWDLSQFEAEQVDEGDQQVGQVPPTASSKILNGYKFKASLPVSVELEDDAFAPMQSLLGTAYAIAFGRGIGKKLINGNGTTTCQGVLTGAADSGITSASGTVLVLSDFENVYFSVNRFHRAAPKCAWLMNDAVYQMTRKAIDGNGRPLISVVKDEEVLMGKPIYVSPSLPAYNPSLGTQANGSFCVFGDLSKLFVRVSKLVIKRSWQLPGYVDRGLALYTGYMRADSKVIDPTAGSVPPIVFAKLHD